MLGLDSVDGAEGQAKETVVVCVLAELGGDRGGSLNSLGSGSNAANDNLVCVNSASRTRAVTILSSMLVCIHRELKDSPMLTVMFQVAPDSFLADEDGL